MKNKWRVLKIAVTVILLGFLLSFSLKRFSQKRLENIAVNLEQSPVYFIDEKDIREMVKKYNPTRKIGDVDIPSLEKKINALPAVDSANVYLNMNGKLNLDIKQRVPAFRLNKDGRDFYVDAKGVEFPTSRNYSHPSMLVTGDVPREDYEKLAELIEKIDRDPFSKKFFIGISKDKDNYNLLTSEANYKVEIGDLDNIDFKVKGFKTFVEKYLVYQDSEKYNKISVKYDNQIVTTLNPNYKENDSVITEANKKIESSPVIARNKALANAQNLVKAKPAAPLPKKAATKPATKNVKASSPAKKAAEPAKKSAAKKETPKKEAAKKSKPAETKAATKKPTAKTTKPAEKKKETTKPKAKVKVE